MIDCNQFTLSVTSPAAASTVVSTSLGGLGKYDTIRVDAKLVGATGGALDVYIQRKLATDVWADWIHYTQLAAAAASISYSLNSDYVPASIGTVGIGSDASPGVVLAAGTTVGGHPGETIRLVFVAGASTSAGAALLFYFTCFGRK